MLSGVAGAGTFADSGLGETLNGESVERTGHEPEGSEVEGAAADEGGIAFACIGHPGYDSPSDINVLLLQLNYTNRRCLR